MRFNIGDILNVDGEEYHVIGRITYKNTEDGMHWDEYRLRPLEGYTESWLSVDETFDEYSVSTKASIGTSTAGYHLVDQGTEVVVSREGNVDVDPGDRAQFFEYEDSTEEKTISREVWDDETEVSTGYYLDKDEFYFVRHDTEYKAPGAGSAGLTLIVLAIVALFILLPDLIGSIHFTPTIRKTLDKNSSFTYVTSITGEDKQKARVYSVGSYYTVGDAAKWIIDGIEGETEVVQQDDEDPENGSIGILTKKEYCLVYKGEDGEVLAQVSNRKYAYTTDNMPYHSTSRAHRYYRRFYYSGGYDSDSRKYKSSSSPYSSYDGDSMSFSSSDTYSSYSSSVRQTSIYSRSSSGGGLSSGK